jgi:hypothetical protein
MHRLPEREIRQWQALQIVYENASFSAPEIARFARFAPRAGAGQIDFHSVLLYHIGYSFSVSIIIPFLCMRCNR